MYTDFVYDFDGTLSDSYPIFVESFLELLHRHGMEDTAEHVLALLKTTVQQTIEYYPFHATLEEIADEYRDIRQPMIMERVQPIEGARELLSHVVARGGRNYLYTHSGDFVWTLLERWGIKEYFTDAITKDDGFPSKPAPDALQHLIAKHGLDRARTVMVGDRDIDVDAAHNAGIAGALLDLDGFYRDYPCEHCFATLAQFKALIQ